MKATVVAIQSKQYYDAVGLQKERRITLLFDYGNKDTERLTIPESKLGIVGIALDDIVDIHFSIDREGVKDVW